MEEGGGDGNIYTRVQGLMKSTVLRRMSRKRRGGGGGRGERE